MSYAVGSLVHARGREWVILPGSDEELLMVRPLGGAEDEITGILTALEKVQPARFDLPDPGQLGDYRSCHLLRDALRIGFRSSAGPFRSFGRIAVEPRPYQLTPLLMALRLDPVRLLIADDVGIGKTIEACLIARELLDRGEIERIAVLCPPQLAEQWQSELEEKFHISAELVLTHTAGRLERECRPGESLFEHYPFVVVSTDFIKSDRRRDDFLRTCPEFVIVDEAHTCAFAGERNRGQHQRHQLIQGISRDRSRHLLLVTATPHSGKEDAFRSLLALLDEEFRDLPENLAGPENETHRRRLANHFVQRQRGHIKAFMGEETRFPERVLLEPEPVYKLSEAYRQFFNQVISYARETVAEPGQMTFRQRVAWWSALALLRALASSPAAAAATLRNRAAAADTETIQEADEIGRRTVLDLVVEEAAAAIDATPGSDVGELAADERKNRERLLRMARTADSLMGAEDNKLQGAIGLIRQTLADGYHPIIFCRFIPTVHYLADALRSVLPREIEIAAITGDIPPSERETRIEQLAASDKRILVCTDALSEGINLQEHFDAVMHYDLSWNPTRHEQREGRVDRFGQPREKIRVITYYGIDNQIDGIVLDVLLRKHRQIRNALGISIPVPAQSDQLIEAIFEGLLLRAGPAAGDQLLLPGFEEYLKPQRDTIARQYDELYKREQVSRSLFAQHSIKVEEVHEELQQVRAAIGGMSEVAGFTRTAVRALGGVLSGDGVLHFDLREVPAGLRDQIGETRFKAAFNLPVPEGVRYLNRTHPFVESLAGYVLETALDPLEKGVARRCGVTRTGRVQRRTTLILARCRYHLITHRDSREKTLLAEEAQLLGFTGAPQEPAWLDRNAVEELLEAQPEANVPPEQARRQISQILALFEPVQARLAEQAAVRSRELLSAHNRVRAAAGLKSAKTRVEPVLPPDVLGIYLYLPV